jgi:hypothetical protein
MRVMEYAEEYDALENRVFKLERKVKNLSWALAIVTDLFDAEDFARALKKKEEAEKEGGS